MKYCLCGLIIFLCCIGLSLEQDPEVATQAPGSASGSEATNSAPKARSSSDGGSKCKANELLSENGCVDRDYFLNRVVMQSWKDESFDKAKEAAGLVDTTECKINEVKTPFGCSRAASVTEDFRVRVHHSNINGEEVLYSNYGSNFSPFARSETPEKKPPYKGPPINAHNRPRKNYILPGRRLPSDRRCRPYETLGEGGKCVRKKGKNGTYEHRNHVYGHQRRHRHSNSVKINEREEVRPKFEV